MAIVDGGIACTLHGRVTCRLRDGGQQPSQCNDALHQVVSPAAVVRLAAADNVRERLASASSISSELRRLVSGRRGKPGTGPSSATIRPFPPAAAVRFGTAALLAILHAA